MSLNMHMGAIPLYYIDETLFKDPYLLVTAERSEITLKSDGEGSVVTGFNANLDLFGTDLAVLVAMFSNVLDGKGIEWRAGPIVARGGGEFMRIAAQADLHPLQADLKTVIAVDENNFAFTASLDACAKVKALRNGKLCFGGLCETLYKDPVNLILPADYTCFALLSKRRLNAITDLWDLQSELYKKLQINLELPVSNINNL